MDKLLENVSNFLDDTRETLDNLIHKLNDLGDKLDDLGDTLITIRDNSNKIDLEDFVEYLKKDNLYTPELEKFISYYVTCHSD